MAPKIDVSATKAALPSASCRFSGEGRVSFSSRMSSPVFSEKACVSSVCLNEMLAERRPDLDPPRAAERVGHEGRPARGWSARNRSCCSTKAGSPLINSVPWPNEPVRYGICSMLRPQSQRRFRFTYPTIPPKSSKLPLIWKVPPQRVVAQHVAEEQGHAAAHVRPEGVGAHRHRRLADVVQLQPALVGAADEGLLPAAARRTGRRGGRGPRPPAARAAGAWPRASGPPRPAPPGRP